MTAETNTQTKTSNRPMLRTLMWAGLVGLLLLMLITAVVFLLASSVPENYQPFRLSQPERRIAAEQFINNHGLKLLESVRVRQPFEHTITESEANRYLASLDEIAYLKPTSAGGPRPEAELSEAMDRVGLAAPAVTMQDGVLTMMVRSDRLNKVISLDIAFEFPDDDHVQIALRQVRIGRLPVPQSMVDEALAQLRKAVTRRMAEENISPQDFEMIIAGVLASIGQEPVSRTIPFSRKHVHELRSIDVGDGKLTVRFTPVDTD